MNPNATPNSYPMDNHDATTETATSPLPFPRCKMLPCIRARQRVYVPDEDCVFTLDRVIVRNGDLADLAFPHDRAPTPGYERDEDQWGIYNGTNFAQEALNQLHSMESGDLALKFLDRINELPDAYYLHKQIQTSHYGPVYLSYALKSCIDREDADWVLTKHQVCAVKDMGWNKIRLHRSTSKNPREDAIRECDALQYFGILVDYFENMKSSSSSTYINDFRYQNILHQQDLIFDAQCLYSILPYYNAKELFDKMTAKIEGSKKSHFSEDVARYYIRQILFGLNWLHNIAGVCHLDIKPENIMLHTKSDDNMMSSVDTKHEDYNVTLIDFGACLRVPFQKNNSSSVDVFSKRPQFNITKSKLVGTAQYRSPELNNQTIQEYNGFACDMWSVGVILYCMLTCSLPCEEAKNTNLRFRYILKHRLMELLNFDSQDRIEPLSAEVKEFLAGLLCVDPSKRFTVDDALSHTWLHKDLNDDLNFDEINFDWLDAEQEMNMDWIST